MSEPTLYAWCFSHGCIHRFITKRDPWCTATWAPLVGSTEAEALADKQTRYGDAQFLHQLPDMDVQLALVSQEPQ